MHIVLCWAVEMYQDPALYMSMNGGSSGKLEVGGGLVDSRLGGLLFVVVGPAAVVTGPHGQ